jgi:FMN reductase [NAD(P)H]
MNSTVYPNETIRLLHERASLRSFSERKIEPEVLQYILEAGIHAPTGGNLQPYAVIKIEEKERKETLAKLCGDQSFIADAPVDLLFCIDLHRLERWTELEAAPFTARHSFRHFWISFQDTIICAQNICTAADALGLGSVYVGTVLECFRELREICHLPNGIFPVVLLCLGYPKKTPSPRNKLGVTVIVHDETYHEMDDTELATAYDEKYAERKFKITEKRLETIERVCQEIGGEKLAQRCRKLIDKRGYISMAQYYFGLHYRANEMPEDNDTYIATLEESGFTWFRKYEQNNRK